MSCSTLNQLEAKLYINWKKCNKKSIKNLLSVILNVYSVFCAISKLEEVSSNKFGGYLFRFFFLPST